MNIKRINLLKSFIADDPNEPFNKYALAMEYYELKPNDSMALLQNLLQDHPGYLPTYFKLAHLLWDNEEWELADKVFKNGLSLAEEQNDSKTYKELKSAYLNFELEKD